MSHDQIRAKLIRMANQIATFFLSQPEDTRAEGVATHINKFWEPRMRRQFFEHLDQGGEGFLPLVIQASALVRRPQTVKAEKTETGQGPLVAKGGDEGRGSEAGEALSETGIPEKT